MINVESGFNSLSELDIESIKETLSLVTSESHRSEFCKTILKETRSLLKEYLRIPDDFSLLFFQGGSSMQFHMINNFGKGCYLSKGYWSSKAYKASLDGVEIFDVKDLDLNCNYFHYCSNETVEGSQVREFYRTPMFNIVDMSSDMMTRKIDWDTVDMVYAHSQKTLGVAGLTIVIIRDKLLEKEASSPSILSYNVNKDHDSVYNTIPVFSLNSILTVAKSYFHKFNFAGRAEFKFKAASKQIYDAIDSSLLYESTTKNRSYTTIVFNLKKEYQDFEPYILKYFEARGLKGFLGHRSVKGFRFSLAYHHLDTNVINDLVSILTFEDFEIMNKILHNSVTFNQIKTEMYSIFSKLSLPHPEVYWIGKPSSNKIPEKCLLTYYREHV